jgi:hypothetical protein
VAGLPPGRLPQQQDKHRCEGRRREAKRHQAQQVYHDDISGMLFADSKAYVGVRDSVHGFKLHLLGGQPFGGVSVTP